MLFVVPNTSPKQMSSTAYFTQPHQNRTVAVPAFWAVWPSTDPCSSSQHKQGKSDHSPVLSLSLISAVQHTSLLQSTKNQLLYGTSHSTLSGIDLSRMFVTLDSPVRGIQPSSAFPFGVAISAAHRSALESSAFEFRPKSFGIRHRSLSKQWDTSNKCDLLIWQRSDI